MRRRKERGRSKLSTNWRRKLHQNKEMSMPISKGLEHHKKAQEWIINIKLMLVQSPLRMRINWRRVQLKSSQIILELCHLVITKMYKEELFSKRSWKKKVTSQIQLLLDPRSPLIRRNIVNRNHQLLSGQWQICSNKLMLRRRKEVKWLKLKNWN